MTYVVIYQVPYEGASVQEFETRAEVVEYMEKTLRGDPLMRPEEFIVYDVVGDLPPTDFVTLPLKELPAVGTVRDHAKATGLSLVDAAYELVDLLHEGKAKPNDDKSVSETVSNLLQQAACGVFD